MRRSTITGSLFALILTLAFAFPAIAKPAVGTGVPFVVTMSGAQEAPGPGDLDGSGTAILRLNPGTKTVCWHLTVEDIAPGTAAHIHVASVGEPGPVVVPLSGTGESGESSGCTSADRDLILAIIQNPEGYYVNVHNAEFPGGAVRGQLG